MKILFGFFVSIIASSSFADLGGGKEGGGGDAYALEFATLAHTISEQLANRTVKVDGVDPALFALKIGSLNVSSKDKTFLNGVEVDAINYPKEARVELNRGRWAEYGNDTQKKLYLVFHEIISLMNFKDNIAQVTRFYLTQINNLPLSNQVRIDGYAYCIGQVAKVHKWGPEYLRQACNHPNPDCVARLVSIRDNVGPQYLIESCAPDVHPYCVQMVARTNIWSPDLYREACTGETAECVAYLVSSRPGWLPSLLIETCKR